MKNYNIVEYWNKRKNPCSTIIEEFTKHHLNFLKKQVVDCKKILDFGPGYGRLFEAYKNSNSVVGIDVTNQHENSLKDTAKKHGFDFELFLRTDNFSKIDYPDKFFDAVVTIEVLFHQTPDVIEFLMKELLRVSKKVIAVTGMNLANKFDNLKNYKPSNKYCFTYDYYKICRKNNWKIYNEERLKTQLMFIYEEE